jgi:hypothetical protein
VRVWQGGGEGIGRLEVRICVFTSSQVNLKEHPFPGQRLQNSKARGYRTARPEVTEQQGQMFQNSKARGEGAASVE